MIEPKVYDNFFSEDQIARIKAVAEANQDKANLVEERGRTDIQLYGLLDQDILNTISGYVKSLGDQYAICGQTFSEYTNKYSKPNLPMHKDPNNVILTFDYHLESSIDWPVYVEGECFNLKPNQALLFSSSKQQHWRPDITFSDGDYVRMMFLYVTDTSL